MSVTSYIISSVVLVLALIIAVVAEARVSSTYSTYKNVEAKAGITGRELAEKIIAAAGLNVSIRKIGGTLTDNYDPTTKTLNLSKGNYESTSLAALGVVAHECGHALQDAKNYKPLKIRHAVINVTNFLSRFLMPLFVVGLILDLMYIGGITGMVFIWSAVAIYALSVLVSLATLPVEYNASSRAMKMLKGFEIMDDDELARTDKVLSAAALTYVASLLVSLAYFFRFLLIALSAISDR